MQMRGNAADSPKPYFPLS